MVFFRGGVSLISKLRPVDSRAVQQPSLRDTVRWLSGFNTRPPLILDEVKILGSGVSPFEWRIIWALKMKGIEFEFIKEDIFKKSSLLLESNPVHKMIPVFIHGEKAISDSLIILEYIDETWIQNPIMSKDPHDRAYTRFWAKFSEDQLVEPSRIAFSHGGEEQAKAVKVMAEALEILEGEIGGKKFFGGETMGYLDIVIGWIGYWLQFTQQVGNYKVMDSAKYPEINLWINRFLQVPIIKKNLPPYNEMLRMYKMYKQMSLDLANVIEQE